MHESRCSCGGDVSPCKHVIALEETWRINPASFLDLDEFLARLDEQPKERLLEMIGQLVVRWPAILGILHVSGFERDLGAFKLKPQGSGQNRSEEDWVFASIKSYYVLYMTSKMVEATCLERFLCILW